MPVEGESKRGRKPRIPKSVLDYHDYIVELELPADYKQVTEACVKQRGSRVTIDLDCTHGSLEPIEEEETEEKTE